MTKFRTILMALALIGSFNTLAVAGSDQKISRTACGAATVEIIGIPYPDLPGGNAFEKITLKAKTSKKHIEIVFEGKTSRGEYFDAACLENATGKSYIVFQNYCGGSGCRDLDNYGIIETSNLKVLLMPDDTNHKKAAEILGLKEPPFLFRDKRRFF